jgi:membrane protease subunit HflK
MKRVTIFLLIALVAYLATGVYFVQPDEQAVVRRFGRVLPAASEPGAHFGLPWGLDRVVRIKPREAKRVVIGPLQVAGDAVGRPPSQFLTGDRNLVNVRATVQYSIADPPRYLFRSTSVDPLIAKAGEAALTEILAADSVDRALTLGKQELGIRAAEAMQRFADRYELGVLIRSVDVAAVEPPPEVAEAFANVTAALRQRERQINEARSFADRTVAQAGADAGRIVNEGRSYRDQTVRSAEADAERFERLLAEYRQAPELTARRLYLETMAATLPRFRSKLILDSGEKLDLSILREEKKP